MLSRKMTFTTGLLAVLLGLSACASKPETTATDTLPVQQPVQQVEKAPEGPVPGSEADLIQNVGQLVYFGYNEHTLTAEAQQVLSRQAAWLKEYPETRIKLAGNCDERGTREYNFALGARRANAAKAFLVSKGIDAARITTISYGKERPEVAGSNEAAWSKNRNAKTTLVSAGA